MSDDRIMIERSLCRTFAEHCCRHIPSAHSHLLRSLAPFLHTFYPVVLLYFCSPGLLSPYLLYPLLLNSSAPPPRNNILSHPCRFLSILLSSFTLLLHPPFTLYLPPNLSHKLHFLPLLSSMLHKKIIFTDMYISVICCYDLGSEKETLIFQTF